RRPGEACAWNRRRNDMTKESRFQQAVRAVWERSHDEYLGWPEMRRAAADPAVEALMTSLRRWTQESALELYYWQPGDPPGVLLLEHLPEGFTTDERLMLEEACFWRRLLELRAGG